ncbi:hypothetical protein BH24ACT5_BH24ACT5_01560 [soil metagenome]
MAPLSATHVDDLLAACAAFAHERRHLVTILTELRTTFPAVRHALNKLAALNAVPPAVPDPAPRPVSRARQ